MIRSRQAAELGISRSEFFARAVRLYLDELASHLLTQQINEALRSADDDSNAAAGRSYLAARTTSDRAPQYLLGRSRRNTRQRTRSALVIQADSFNGSA